MRQKNNWDKSMKSLVALFFFSFVSEALAWDCENIVAGVSHLCPVKFISAVDHVSPKTGIVGASATCYVSKNGGIAQACAGTLANEIDAVNKPGIAWYTPGAGDVDTAGVAELTFQYSGADNAEVSMLIGGLPVQMNGIRPESVAPDGTLASVVGNTIVLNGTSFVSSTGQLNSGWKISFLATGREGSSCVLTSTNGGGGNDSITIAGVPSPAPIAGDTFILYPEAACANVAELTSVPSSGATTWSEMLRFLYQQFRFKTTDNGVVQRSYKADNSTTLCSRSVSDSGSVYTRGACN